MPNPMIENYLAELSRSPTMHSALEEFLAKVYKDGVIMAGGTPAKERVDLIYNLYSADSDGQRGEKSDKFLFDVYTAASQSGLLKRHPFFQGIVRHSNGKPVTLEAVGQLLLAGKRPRSEVYSAFIYFPDLGGAGAVTRLYLNVVPDELPRMLRCIGDHLREHPDHGARDFKIAGPDAAAGRKDTVVVYCESEEKARSLGDVLAKSGVSFRAATPALTTTLSPGLAIGSEPMWQGTGMYFDERTYNSHKNSEGEELARRYGETAQSFGTIRAQLIAMAIENYNENGSVLNDRSDFEKLKRFVCVAFRGYGLDPEHPGS